MTFEEAVSRAVLNSRLTGNVVYVYAGDSEYPWSFSNTHKEGWLFKAFPGGRRILSREGRNILGRGLDE